MPVGDWPERLDRVLPRLDLLKPAHKERLVRAMLAVVLADGRAVTAEIELLRAAGAVLHVPLPLSA